MTSDATGDHTAAERIFEDLRAAIRDGRLGPDARIPAERDLAARYEVARGTAQRARAMLERHGLAVTRPRSGMFVRSFPSIERVTPDRLRGWRQGGAIQAPELGARELLVDAHVDTVEAPGYVADALGLASGTSVIVRARAYAVDGRTVQYARSYVPSDIAAGTAIAATDPGPGGIYARLDDLGHEPAHGVERLLPQDPGGPDVLGLPEHTPTYHVERRVYSRAGRCVEVNYMALDATVYLPVYRFDF